MLLNLITKSASTHKIRNKKTLVILNIMAKSLAILSSDKELRSSRRRQINISATKVTEDRILTDLCHLLAYVDNCS